jgi:hypothetical protein
MPCRACPYIGHSACVTCHASASTHDAHAATVMRITMTPTAGRRAAHPDLAAVSVCVCVSSKLKFTEWMNRESRARQSVLAT